MDIFNAIKKNDVQSVQTIMNEDPSVIHHSNSYHEIPLHTACSYGYTEIAQILIDAGADVHVKDTDGWTPLHSACGHVQTDVVQLLIDAGADVHVKDQKGRTPLHSVCYYNHTEIPKLLLKVGADVNARTDQNWTPLHLTCFYGFKDLARLFIEADANVDWLAVTENGRTPIDLAINNKRNKFLHFVAGFIDQLPVPEQKKLRAWRFRQEFKKTS